MRNAALILGAVAVLVIGFVLVAGADESSTPTTSTAAGPAPTTATTPAADPSSQASSASSAAPAPEPTAPKLPVVRVVDGKPDGGVQTLRFTKGEEVRFRVVSDIADEIHVHGFDKYADVAPGRSVRFAFPAKFDGKYEVELHGSGTQIASLEIQP